jgi:hypothetical protein
MHMQSADEVPVYQMAVWVMHGEWPSPWQRFVVHSPHQLPGAAQTLLYSGSRKQLHLALYSIANCVVCGRHVWALPGWGAPLLEMYRIEHVSLINGSVSLEPLVLYHSSLPSADQSTELCPGKADTVSSTESQFCDCPNGNWQLGALSAGSNSTLQWAVGAENSTLSTDGAHKTTTGAHWLAAWVHVRSIKHY